MQMSLWRRHAWALVGFAGLAALEVWPLPLEMATHLTGSPAGDTGVYVWNLWTFSHEIFATGTTPLSTLTVFPLAGGPADLSLHNYTVFSDVVAMPLLPLLGVVATFNVVYLFNAALAGFGLYLLAHRLTGRAAESFVAGLMFAWSPFLVTRGMGHFSLAAAAPLPFLMLALYRAWDSQRLRDALLAGATLAWAAFSDPYYAVYGLMLGACFLASRVLDVRLVRRPVEELGAARHLLDVAIVSVVVLVLGIRVLAGGSLHVGAFRVSMRTLFTPMLVLTGLVLARLALAATLRVRTMPVPSRRFLVSAIAVCGLVSALLLSPTLFAMGRQAVQGDVSTVPVLWRSSAPGVDLLSFLIPNPNHPFAPVAVADWMASRPGGYLDQVASLSLVAFAVLAGAWWFAGFRPPRFWLVLTIGFALLSLGPFVQIAGVNTGVPTPWALFRYAPLIGSARMPARLVAVVTLGFSMLLAFALVALTSRYPARRTRLLSIVGLMLGAELLAAPRTLYSARVSAVFNVVAADPRPVRVLELPTGVRDGLSSIGDFSAQAQFNQTFHGKGVIGGYLSRVPPSIKARYRRMPVTSALIDISEGRGLDRARRDRAIDGADEFLRATNLGYVVIDQARASADLRQFATVLLGLTKIAEADGYELYVPRRPAQEKRP
jgi:hypothetical protein